MTEPTPPTTADPAVLVLGGTGKTGRRIVDRLRAREIPVPIGSRSAPMPFEWSDPGTWRPALAGVDAVYIARDSYDFAWDAARAGVRGEG